MSNTTRTTMSSGATATSIHDVVEWLLEQGRADGRLRAHRVQSVSAGGTADAAPASSDAAEATAAAATGEFIWGDPTATSDGDGPLDAAAAESSAGSPDTDTDTGTTPRVTPFEAMPDPLKVVLVDRGIGELYPHQARAITAARAGHNVVLATPTASGKSLAYQIPALERALRDGRHALYIAPQRALINDQEETLRELAQDIRELSGPDAEAVQVAQYTGRLSTDERRYVRSRQPHLLLTTPDMVNYSLLPYAGQLWHWFFSRLDLVVIDEVHRYRGVFGTHVSHVLRRLRRVCTRFDAAPQLFCMSATIGNPTRHPAMVTGAPPDTFETFTTDASPRGDTHWVFWQPAETGPTTNGPGAGTGTGAGQTSGSGDRRSSHTEAAHVAADLVERGLQTVVFTRARQTAEQYATHTARQLRDRGHDDLAAGVAAYQAALSSTRRHHIEDGLHDGSLRAVWSTNALELGVDVGGLDAIVLDGYPGTRMETHQQAGRAGRNGTPSLVVLIGGDDPLDQYVLDHPDELIDEPPEGALINPMNTDILEQHLPAAAVEYPLAPRDTTFFTDRFPAQVSALVEAGTLEREVTADGLRWTAPRPVAATAPGVDPDDSDSASDGGDGCPAADGGDESTPDSASTNDTDTDSAAGTATDDSDASGDGSDDASGDGSDDASAAESPQHAIDLRTITDRTLQLVDARTGDEIGDLAFPDGLRDAHPGAIYFHQGERYVVTDLDTDADIARLAPTAARHTTVPTRDTSVAVNEVVDEQALGDAPEATAQLCAVTVTDQVVGYRELTGGGSGSGSPSAPIPLELPATTLETQAVALTVPPAIVRDLRRQATAQQAADAAAPPVASALQGLAHALAQLAPLEVLCDPSDLASVAVPHHPATDAPTLFLYDTHPGGVGLARGSFARFDALLEAAHERITGCGCTDGCPACVHQPHQARGNETADKALAAWLATAVASTQDTQEVTHS